MLKVQKLVFINLSFGNVSTVNVPPEITRCCLGGRGLNMFMLWQQVCMQEPAGNSGDYLFVTPGLLTGTSLPCASRTSISGISPETGYIGDANIGGFFGPALKAAGIDGIVITGKAKEPSVLYIDGDNVSVQPAANLWGTNINRFRENLEQCYGKEHEWIAIGRAGENGVRFACIISGWKNAAGRTGMGCLMGSKLLKAIIVRKSVQGKVNVNDSFDRLSNELKQKIADTGFAEKLREYGTPFLYHMHNNLYQICRVHNGTRDGRFEDEGGTSLFDLKKKYVRKKGCYGCVIGCRHGYMVELDGEQKYGEGPEYGMLGNFGPVCGIKSMDDILKINIILNDYGLDCCSCASLIALLIQLYKDRTASIEDIGFDIDWGDAEGIIKLVRLIGENEGVGAILAKGIKGMEERFGITARENFIGVKNLPQSDSVDLRNLPGFALGIATSTRGADHLRSRPTFEILGLPKEDIAALTGMSGDIAEGSPEYKAWLVYWSEILYAVVDSIGICKFVSKFNNIDLVGLKELSALLSEALGESISEKDVSDMGNKILTVERLVLAKMGLGKKDDKLPDMYFKPIVSGRNAGKVIDREFFNDMLKAYYNYHNWNDEGIPDAALVNELEALSKKCGGDFNK